MRIVFTVATYYPMRDGVQSITQFYAEAMAANGHKVTVLTGKCGNCAIKENYHGVQIYRIDLRTKAGLYIGNVDQYRALVQEISKESDVMINVSLQTATTDCILDVLPQIKCHKILYMHGMVDTRFPQIQNIRFMDIARWILYTLRWKNEYKKWKPRIKLYDAVIHLHSDDPSVQYARSCGITENWILENGSDFYTDDKQAAYSSEYYICIGNFLHNKNQEYVLEAYYRSQTRKNLVFVGSSENRYLARLKRIHARYEKHNKSCGQVIWAIGKSRQEIQALLEGAFCFLSGSKIEKYPVVLSEAMAYGVPFISTDTGIVRHLPGGVTVKDKSQMACMISKLETEKLLWEKLSLAGKQYSQQHQNMKNNQNIFESNLKKLVYGNL